MFFVLVLLLGVASAITPRVATKACTEPFSYKIESARWAGYSHGFLELLAGHSDRIDGFEIVEFGNNHEIFQAVLSGAADVGHCAITKSADRELFLEFTHSFFESGFKLMVHNDLDLGKSLGTTATDFFSGSVFTVLIMLIISILSIALVVWYVEHIWPNPKRVGLHERFAKGYREAIVWTALVLFQKQSSVQPQGRVSKCIGAFISVFGVIILMTITGLITVAIQSTKLRNRIESFADLRGHSVGTVNMTVSESFLTREGGGVIIRSYSTVDMMFAGFHNDEIDAIVYDYPILQYHVQRRLLDGKRDALVVGDVFQEQTYGMVIAPGSNELREELNRAILTVRSTYDYHNLYDRWILLDVSSVKLEERSYISGIIIIVTVAVVIIWVAVLWLGLRCKRARRIAREKGSTVGVVLRKSVKNPKGWRERLSALHQEDRETRHMRDTDFPFRTYEGIQRIREMLIHYFDQTKVGALGDTPRRASPSHGDEKQLSSDDEIDGAYYPDGRV